MRVLARQQVAERWNRTVPDELRHLIAIAADRQVADRPGRFLLRLEFTLAQVLDDLGQQSGIDDGLHLRLVSGGYIRQEPNCFLADFVLWMTQQRREVRQSIAIEHNLEIIGILGLT